MSEPRCNVRMRNGAKRSRQSLEQGLERPRFRRSQSGLDLRPAEFNWIEVRRVGRQEFQARSLGFDDLTGMRSLVRRQVIDHDNIPAPQGRGEYSLDVGLEGHAIHGPFQEPGGLHPVPAQGGDQGVAGSGIARYGFHHSPPGRTPPKQPGQAQIHPAFIDEFQVLDPRTEFLGDPICKCASQVLDPQRVPLASVERLFFAAGRDAVTRGTSCWDSPSPFGR
jgi:hypothetical protein